MLRTIDMPGQSGCRKATLVPTRASGSEFRSSSDRPSTGEASSVGLAILHLQSASESRYATSQMAGWDEDMGNVH
jgi:hypothetical protein